MVLKGNNKKAIGYFSLIGPVCIVLLLLLFVGYVRPTENIKQDIDFGKTTIDIDIINYKIASEEFFLKEEISRSIQRAKLDFTKSYGLTTSEQLKLAQDSCKYKNIFLWYNEQNLNLDKSSCLPEFNLDSDENLKTHIKEVISEDLKNDLTSFNILSSPNVDIIDKNDGKVEVKISIDFEEKTQISKISKTTTYSKEYNLNSYAILLKSLQNSIPEISKQAEESVPICLSTRLADKSNTKNSQQLEIDCIGLVILKLTKEKFIELGGNEKDFANYDFQITNLKSKDETLYKGYYILKINVASKDTNKNELEFALVLKDTIPTSLISFDVKPFLGADNTIDVKIFEPKDSSDIDKYIVIYSYEDFFNQNSYSGYDNLIKMLQTSLVPGDFEQTGFTDDGGAYYYSKPQSNLGLSLILVNKDNFKESSDANYKDIKLYQMYNYQTNKWELLDGIKPIYAFVFAADYNRNYYVKDLSGKAVSIIPQKVFGASPLSSQNIINMISIANMDNSFSFEITGYDDLSFDHYDIYIINNIDENTIVQNCLGIEPTKCYYIDGSGSLTEKIGKFALVSSSNTNLDGYTKTIFISTGIIQSGTSYKVAIVPVDNSGKSILLPQFKEYSFVQKNDYYELKEDNTNERYQALFTQITPKDSSKPNPITSITLLSNQLNLVEGKYYLQYSPIELDVTGVYVTYQILDSSGALKKRDTVLLGLDGYLFENMANYAQIEVLKIIPVDSSGNKEDIATYLGQTYTASYP